MTISFIDNVSEFNHNISVQHQLPPMEDETEEDDDQEEEDNSDPPLEFDKRRVAEVIRAGGGNVLASFPGSGMIPILKLVLNFNNF